MKQLCNMRISTRLTCGFSIILLLAILSTVVGLLNAKRNAEATRIMMDLPLSKERLVEDWFVLTYSAIARTSMIARSSDAGLSDAFKQEIVASVTAGSAIIKKIEPLLTSDEEKTLFKQIVVARQQYQHAKEMVMASRKSADADVAEKIYREDFDPAAKTYAAKVHGLLDMQRQAINQMALTIDHNNQNGMQLMLTLGVLLIVLSMAAVVIISRSITSPLQRALKVARMVAAGDLTAAIDRQGKDGFPDL